ncbi:MAG: 50S ribosomal protein L13 [Candidatus Aenigmarchaeota archaeon]|nr:50S ribosomal protein L13 [Candidatus Aenigmarchaeota archaeon]
MKVYDFEGMVLGRIASRVAKDLLKGENVVVVNAEKAVISGDPQSIIKRYVERLHKGDPKKGPFYPKTPDGIVKRTIRGMLPWHKPRGRDAFKRLKVFVGVPKEFEGKERIKLEDANVDKLRCKYITVGDLAVALGAKKRW